MAFKTASTLNLARRFRVEPGAKVNLQTGFDPGDTAGYDKPENADEVLQEGIDLLAAFQEKLYAENSRGLLVVLQALDAAGKDSIIEHVMSGLNPQGCQVTCFKTPSAEELDHDYLWRVVKALPMRGNLGIFNRSHYEEVLAVRVHPEYLAGQRLPPRSLGPGIWSRRFAEINNFERFLVDNGFEVVKIFLNVSAAEQCRRQLERIDKPEKNWKFKAADLKERPFRSDYMTAYEDLLQRTSTPWAPWHVVPADHKWFTRIAVAAIIADKLIEMDPQYPTVGESDRQAMQAGRQSLVDECGEGADDKGKSARAGGDRGAGGRRGAQAAADAKGGTPETAATDTAATDTATATTDTAAADKAKGGKAKGSKVKGDKVKSAKKKSASKKVGKAKPVQGK